MYDYMSTHTYVHMYIYVHIRYIHIYQYRDRQREEQNHAYKQCFCRLGPAPPLAIPRLPILFGKHNVF